MVTKQTIDALSFLNDDKNEFPVAAIPCCLTFE